MTIDQKYDQLLAANLKQRLKRNPLPHELANADYDADLVNETLWQLIRHLDERLSARGI